MLQDWSETDVVQIPWYDLRDALIDEREDHADTAQELRQLRKRCANIGEELRYLQASWPHGDEIDWDAALGAVIDLVSRALGCKPWDLADMAKGAS